MSLLIAGCPGRPWKVGPGSLEGDENPTDEAAMCLDHPRTRLGKRLSAHRLEESTESMPVS